MNDRLTQDSVAANGTLQRCFIRCYPIISALQLIYLNMGDKLLPLCVPALLELIGGGGGKLKSTKLPSS